jgi:two-component system NtrC family sensor kinase
MASAVDNGRRTVMLHSAPGPDLARGQPGDAPGASERDQRFLRVLGQQTRSHSSPHRILRDSAELLGRHLGVNRVSYGQVDPEEACVTVEADWHDGSVGSLAGRFALPPGVSSRTRYGRGSTIVVDDWREMVGVLPEEQELIRKLGMNGFVMVPLVKEGRLVALMTVQQTGPRQWTEAEIWLAEEVAERIWAALERARAEGRRVETEIQFRTLAENMPDICWVADADGHGFWYNRRGESLYGPRTGRAPRLSSYCHPEDLDTIRSAWADAIARGVRYEATARYRSLDGVYRPFLSRAEPVKDGAGQVVQWCGVVTDLTEQVAAEKRLQLLQQLNEALRDELSASAILSTTTELLGRALGASRVCYAEAQEPGHDVMSIAHGWTDGTVNPLPLRLRHSFLGQAVVDHHRRGLPLVVDNVVEHPLMSPKVAADCEAVGYCAGVDVPLVKEGRLVAFLSVHQSTPRKWTSHETGLIGEVAERTWAALERGRAEEKRRQSQALLTAITEHAPLGIYLKDTKGRYLLANPQMARLMRKPVSEIVGRSAAELFPPEFAERAAERDAEVLRSGQLQTSELHMPGRRTYEWVMVMRFPVRLEPDGPLQVAGFDIDVSAQKRIELDLKRSQEALYQSEKLTALGSLLAGVSHELNNPLSIIVAQAVMVERQAVNTPIADRAGKIRKAAERAARIVQTFLAMARQKTPERKPVMLNDIINAALELTDYGLRTGGVQVTRNLAPDLPPILADADQLHQVVVNLVINAQQAMADQSCPRLLTLTTLSQGPDRLVIEIADSGPGVPRDIRRRIFEPFFTTKPQSVGTGVGLSFSLGLVEAHGGRLELLDREGGTTFRITLPVQPMTAASLESDGEGVSAVAQLSQTALIIDDERDIAEALADLLNLEGYSSEIAVGGVAARDRLASARGDFDLIVSDLRMPDMDGPALYTWLKANRPELASRLAFATGDTLSVSAARFLTAADRPFIEKPFTPEGLQRLVAQVRARRTADQPS